jgi:hypothetical protein
MQTSRSKRLGRGRDVGKVLVEKLIGLADQDALSAFADPGCDMIHPVMGRVAELAHPGPAAPAGQPVRASMDGGRRAQPSRLGPALTAAVVFARLAPTVREPGRPVAVSVIITPSDFQAVRETCQRRSRRRISGARY